MNVEARLFTVHGRVQGVWFRDSTRREAQRLGIKGHAINLANGNVEVMAVGSAAALRELEQWLRIGPPVANVTRLDVATVEAVELSGFRIG
jgi:acylphosphatase